MILGRGKSTGSSAKIVRHKFVADTSGSRPHGLKTKVTHNRSFLRRLDPARNATAPSDQRSQARMDPRRQKILLSTHIAYGISVLVSSEIGPPQPRHDFRRAPVGRKDRIKHFADDTVIDNKHHALEQRHAGDGKCRQLQGAG